MVDKIFNRVKVVLSEPSVQAALKKVREGLKTPNSRRATPIRPVSRPQRAVSRVRRTAGQAVDVGRTVGSAFRRQFEALRKLSAAEVRDAVAAYGRGLTNLALGRRAGAPATDPAQVVGAQPPPPAPAPAPIQTPVQPVIPLAPVPRPIQRTVAPPPLPLSAVTINNYRTNVVIDPRNMVEWKQVLKFWNQLKRMNRAMPRPSAPTLYEWMSPEEKRDLEKTTFSRQSLRNAGWAEKDIDAYLTAQAQRAAKYAALNAQLRDGGKIVQATYRFREERITRFRKIPGLKSPMGPSGFPRQPGQFYFNRKFSGAVYSVPTMTRNRKLVAAARPAIEAARQRMYGLTGQRYTPLREVSKKPVRVFYPSKWGHGTVQLRGPQEAVDSYWMRRLKTASKSKKNQPLLRRLLQND